MIINPKAVAKIIDLHLHLDGSLPIKTVLKLARMQRIGLPSDNENELKKYLSVSPNAQSLNDYLKCFDLPLSLLQTADSVHFAVTELITELDRQGLIYSEIRFAPQLHTKKGCTQEQIIKAAVSGKYDAEKRLNIRSNLILCTMRGGRKEDNLLTVRLAAEYLSYGVCAVDLAGAEALHKTGLYRDVFKLAVKLGVPFTIHAGEADGVQSVQSALSFGAKRIGHGVAAAGSAELMQKIKALGVSVECCITSNLQTKAVLSLNNHPLKNFVDFGINATVNTDNMTVSNTTIEREYELVQNLSPELSKKALLLNAADSAFILPDEKERLKEKINLVMQ